MPVIFRLIETAVAVAVRAGLALTVSFPLVASAAIPPPADLMQTVEDLTAMGVRRPGTAASVQAADYVHARFTAAGLERVSYLPAMTPAWVTEHFSLAIDDQPVPASPMQHTFNRGSYGSFSTPPQGINAPLVYVGAGADIDYWFRNVKGKIVVANVSFGKRPLWLFKPFLLGLQDDNETFGSDYTLIDPYGGGTFPDSYYRAMDGGAVGFIGILEDYFDSHSYRNEAYKSYVAGSEMKLPGVWMSPVAGAELVKKLRSRAWWGRRTWASLHMSGAIDEVEARGVYGYLPGRTDQYLLIQSHHDSATPGGTEDASGSAAVIALAEHFAQQPASEREYGLIFATMDSHFTDYAVHRKFSREHVALGNPSGDRILAAVTIEHIAREIVPGEGLQPTETGLLAPRVMMVTDEVDGLAEIAAGVMADHELNRSVAVPTTLLQWIQGGGIPADSSDFLRHGLPVIALVGAPLYLYDDIDTADKVPPEELYRVTAAFADLVGRLDQLPAENYVRVEQQLEY